jgi:hypothetical protein
VPELQHHGVRRSPPVIFPVATGMAHSIVVGSAWEPAPWRAVQRARFVALSKAETD